MSKGGVFALHHWAFLPGWPLLQLQSSRETQLPTWKFPNWFIFFLWEAEVES